jgi:hypothetical protein
MKQTPQMKKAEREMRAGHLSLSGFLGGEGRDLAQLLNDDHEAVKAMGLTHPRIADRMRRLREVGLSGLGDFVTVPPHFDVRVESVRGRLPCPFGERGLHSKAFTIVRNTRLGRELTFSDLHIHLIAAHGFYEGRGSPFRLEPADLRDILEIVPEETA